ncbi:MAG: hypothetical protein ABJC09_10130 [Terriglobia bacterium]
MGNEQDWARAAGRMAGKWLPKAKQTGDLAKKYAPTARQSGLFVRHVVPAVLKPLHSLWHEILGFAFLVFAFIGAWKLWRSQGTLQPLQFVLVLIFVVVMASYGISSIRKSRRITRS